ncbi:MAG TPA: hypothetical protein VE377_10505 [Candidatus Dormibacteraeota bacterium]|nr:hypothetical protein [Candidatus Dormibacteraeota bacterium]
MAQDGRDILDVLKFELSFLEDGGYGRSPHAPWRAPAVFEDSPICPNFCDPARPHPCESCLLEQFVPEGLRKETVPCRFIPLTQEGQTVDDLYRTGSQVEMETALAVWLRAQIARIERERATKEGAA